jgi:TonB family protein
MKRIFLVLLGLLAFTGWSAENLNAQAAPRAINGGVLNGKASSLPKPEYPAGLKEAGIGGIVAVNIVIDETGSVISAEADLYDQRAKKAEDGTLLDPQVVDAQLRSAAEAAARSAKFAPTLLSGNPTQVKGRIVYNFVPGAEEAAVPAASAAPKTVSGGVLNGKATSLPMPAYPPAAKAVNAGGAVSVQVSVSEDGRVISATAVSGHPLLRSAAEAAAREATFSSTLLNGQPVKITGVLTYNFVP